MGKISLTSPPQKITQGELRLRQHVMSEHINHIYSSLRIHTHKQKVIPRSVVKVNAVADKIRLIEGVNKSVSVRWGEGSSGGGGCCAPPLTPPAAPSAGYRKSVAPSCRAAPSRTSTSPHDRYDPHLLSRYTLLFTAFKYLFVFPNSLLGIQACLQLWCW